MNLIYILLAILMLGILITIHEAGHFFAARLMHIDVTEFGIGMGPKLFGWKSRKYDTRFSVRLIPLGGYCAFMGDETEPEKKDDPRAFGKQNVWKRLFVIAMGPLMNMVLAFVIALLLFLVGGLTVATGVDPYIVQVSAAGAAYDAGVKDGDVITEIDGKNMLDGTMTTLTETLQNWKEGQEPLHVTWKHGEETLTGDMTPVWDPEEERYRIGVIVGGVYRIEKQPTDLPGATEAAWKLCVNSGGAILKALKDLITTGKGFEETSGPVGIISVVSQETRSGGLEAYLQLMILISINLGLMNLLPIPGLDGSRLVFGLIEVIRRKPVPAEKEAMIHLVGMLFLLFLMIFFTFRDVFKLFH